MKSIPAIGVTSDADTKWLDGELKAQGIAPAWNHGLAGEVKAVLLCVTDNFDYANLADEQKIALYKTGERRILIALFNRDKKPWRLADIMDLDFGADRQTCLAKLVKVIESSIA